MDINERIRGIQRRERVQVSCALIPARNPACTHDRLPMLACVHARARARAHMQARDHMLTVTCT